MVPGHKAKRESSCRDKLPFGAFSHQESGISRQSLAAIGFFHPPAMLFDIKPLLLAIFRRRDRDKMCQRHAPARDFHLLAILNPAGDLGEVVAQIADGGGFPGDTFSCITRGRATG